MSTPEAMRCQMERLTADLIGMSLCDKQKFPSLRNLPDGIREVGISGVESLSVALKNVSYHEIYRELNESEVFNLRMLDGALVQMMYRFREGELESHRLAFYPSPFIEEFQNNPDVYVDDEIYAEVIKKNIVPFPIRFDFDNRENVVVPLEHPKSHLTLGQYQNCRIPVTAPLTPSNFISFLLRNFYHTAYNVFCHELTDFDEGFDRTICAEELEITHVNVN